MFTVQDLVQLSHESSLYSIIDTVSYGVHSDKENEVPVFVISTDTTGININERMRAYFKSEEDIKEFLVCTDIKDLVKINITFLGDSNDSNDSRNLKNTFIEYSLKEESGSLVPYITCIHSGEDTEILLSDSEVQEFIQIIRSSFPDAIQQRFLPSV
jgi:hypothetical protein